MHKIREESAIDKMHNEIHAAALNLLVKNAKDMAFAQEKP